MIQPEFFASTTGGVPRRSSSLRGIFRPHNQVERMLDTDVNTYLPDDLLVKMDIATMAHSVETRSPFLDHRLMEFSARVPARHKLDGTSGKVLLKYALRGIVPDEILDRPKMGFGVPLPRWFRKELRDLPAEVLLSADARVQAYVKPEAIRRMIKQHHDNQADHSTRLWALLQLEFWHREVLESRPLGGAGVPSAALRSGRPARLPAVGLRGLESVARFSPLDGTRTA